MSNFYDLMIIPRVNVCGSPRQEGKIILQIDINLIPGQRIARYTNQVSKLCRPENVSDWHKFFKRLATRKPDRPDTGLIKADLVELEHDQLATIGLSFHRRLVHCQGKVIYLQFKTHHCELRLASDFHNRRYWPELPEPMSPELLHDSCPCLYCCVVDHNDYDDVPLDQLLQ